MPIFITFIALLTISSRADTIDFWHIYYNSKLVFQANETTQKVSGLKPIELDSIAPSDTFLVSYFIDAPSFSVDYVDAWDERTRLVDRFSDKNRNAQIIIPAKFMYDRYKRQKATKKKFDFWYCRRTRDGQVLRTLIFFVVLNKKSHE